MAVNCCIKTSFQEEVEPFPEGYSEALRDCAALAANLLNQAINGKSINRCWDCSSWVGRCFKGKINQIARSEACDEFSSNLIKTVTMMTQNGSKSELLGAAQAYYEIGLNVLTIKGKQPLKKGEKWQKQRQTEEEFKSLNFSEADGIGIVCGTRNNASLCLAVIDFDVKNLSTKAIEKGQRS